MAEQDDPVEGMWVWVWTGVWAGVWTDTDKGVDRGVDRCVGRGVDRYGQGCGQGCDRCVDRGMDRGVDRYGQGCGQGCGQRCGQGCGQWTHSPILCGVSAPPSGLLSLCSSLGLQVHCYLDLQFATTTVVSVQFLQDHTTHTMFSIGLLSHFLSVMISHCAPLCGVCAAVA